MSAAQNSKNFSIDSGFNATEFLHQSSMSGLNPANPQYVMPSHLQNIYQIENCPSSKVLFNNPVSPDCYSNDPSNELKNLKVSFNSASKRSEKGKRLV